MTVRNYTTQIDVNKTIMEVEAILLKFGSKGIYKEYNGSRVSSLMFYIEREGDEIQIFVDARLGYTAKCEECGFSKWRHKTQVGEEIKGRVVCSEFKSSEVAK